MSRYKLITDVLCFVILHKETKQQWITHNSKGAWLRESYAKLAFKEHMGIKFDSQDEYEIVNLGDLL